MSRKTQTPQHLDHSAFGPLYNRNSHTLILGSFPSVKSREAAFYYGHPQNRFWRVIRALYDPDIYDAAMRGEPVDPPQSKEEKTALILGHGLALWDTIYSCDIIGSQDAAIRNAEPCDIPWLLERTSVDRIFCNGTVSYNLFMKYCMPEIEEYCSDSSQSGECMSVTRQCSAAQSSAKQCIAVQSATKPHKTVPSVTKLHRTVPSVTKLPSTSPANAAWSLPRLIEAWKAILSSY